MIVGNWFGSTPQIPMASALCANHAWALLRSAHPTGGHESLVELRLARRGILH